MAADQQNRPHLMELIKVFRGRVVDVAPESLIVEVSGTVDKIDGLLEVLRPYGVLEMTRTGRIAMTRGNDILRPPAESTGPVGKISCRVIEHSVSAIGTPRGASTPQIQTGNELTSRIAADERNTKRNGKSLLRQRCGSLPDPGEEGRDYRLWLAGPRARPEPARFGSFRLRGTSRRKRVPCPKRKKTELTVKTPAEAAAWADVIMILAPDTRQQKLYKEAIEPHLTAGKTLMFAHGFNIRFGAITPPKTMDVSMIAPKAPGHRVREVFTEGARHAGASWPSIKTPPARPRHLRSLMPRGLGTTRAGVLETTFTEETETDLFGEQAVLCGGVSELIKAGFETLVNAGYQPEVAYFECLHELKLIVDLIYRGGLSYMRYSVSDTAEHGDYHAGPRIVTQRNSRRHEKAAGRNSRRQFREGLDRGERERAAPISWPNAKRSRHHIIEQLGPQASRHDAVPEPDRRTGHGNCCHREKVVDPQLLTSFQSMR